MSPENRERKDAIVDAVLCAVSLIGAFLIVSIAGTLLLLNILDQFKYRHDVCNTPARYEAHCVSPAVEH